VDLIPVKDRGYVAAAITAIAYFCAAVFSSAWVIEKSTALMLSASNGKTTYSIP
jgi:hypothetical protein